MTPIARVLARRKARLSPAIGCGLIALAAAAVPRPLAAQDRLVNYSAPPTDDILSAADPQLRDECSRAPEVAAARWDANNAKITARVAVAERLATMSELKRNLLIRQINLAIASDDPASAEMQRALDLLVDPQTHDPRDAMGQERVRAYLAEARQAADGSREAWLAAMHACLAHAAVPAAPPPPGDGSWTGSYVSRSYPTTFNFTGGGSTLSASFEGRFGDSHNKGRIYNCRPTPDAGFDCEYTYQHEDAGKKGEVSGNIHYTHSSRCTIEETSSVITKAEFRTLDGSPATSPSMYVGARSSNTYDRQGC
jgi:hypothetical protein